MKRKLVYVPLDDLVPADRNAKEHDDALIAASFARLGLVDVITLDDRTGKIVAGHGRRDFLLKARDAGEAAPDGVVVDRNGAWTVPVVTGWSSSDDVEAEAAGVAMNQTTVAGGWNPERLDSILQDIRASASGLEGVGFTDADLDKLRALYGPKKNLADMKRAAGEPDERDFWPTVRFKVSPDTMIRITELRAEKPAYEDDEAFVVAALDAIANGAAKKTAARKR